MYSTQPIGLWRSKKPIASEINRMCQPVRILAAEEKRLSFGKVDRCGCHCGVVIDCTAVWRTHRSDGQAGIPQTTHHVRSVPPSVTVRPAVTVYCVRLIGCFEVEYQSAIIQVHSIHIILKKANRRRNQSVWLICYVCDLRVSKEQRTDYTPLKESQQKWQEPAQMEINRQ